MKIKTNIFTVCNGKYKEFIPLFILSNWTTQWHGFRTSKLFSKASDAFSPSIKSVINTINAYYEN